MVTLLILVLVVFATISSLSSFMGGFPETSGETEGNGSQEGIEGEDDIGEDDGDDALPETISATQTGWIDPEGGYVSSRPLFEIMGASNIDYIKTSVGIDYTGQSWQLEDEVESLYHGETVDHKVQNYNEMVTKDIEIKPLVEFQPGFIPVTRYTRSLDLEVLIEEESLYHYPDHNIFRSDEGFIENYSIKFIDYEYEEEVLRSSQPIDSPEFYDLPDVITNRTYELAEDITEGVEGTYAKAEAIQEFLLENYEYDLEYRVSPRKHEPVDWFLFEEKKGVCANFNSAFVVLARASDIPARMVSGFRVPTSGDIVDIRAQHSHAWAEIGLEEGWINFDSTGRGYNGDAEHERVDENRTSTQTEIESVDPNSLKRGENLTVEGTVRTIHDQPVDDIQVVILLEEEMKEIGEGRTYNGNFRIEGHIPKDIDLGEYTVIAKSVTDQAYWSSWSHRSFGEDGTSGSDTDHMIRITSPTDIDVDHPDITHPENEVEIEGDLSDDQGEGIPAKNLYLKIDDEFEKGFTTDEYGNFSIKNSFQDERTYSLVIGFNGTEFYDPSSTESELKVRSFRVVPSPKEYLVRGEPTKIEGKTFIDENPVPQEEVLIDIEGEVTVRKTSDGDGRFIHEFTLDQTRELGSLNITYSLSDHDFSTTQELQVRSRPEIDMTIEEEKESDEVEVTVSLHDDKGEALEEKMIFVNNSYDNTTMSGETNDRGEVTLVYSFSSAHGETVDFTAEFEGNEYYIGEEISRTVQLDLQSSSDGLLNDIFERDDARTLFSRILLPIIIGLSSIGYAWKKGHLKKVLSVFRPKKVHNKEKTIGLGDDAKIADKNEVELIRLSQIDEDLPYVWGVGEELTIEKEPETNELVDLYIDGNKFILNDEGKVNHVFEYKGQYEIKAVGKEEEQIIQLRIVDYDDEMKREYGRFLNKVKEKGVKVYNQTTPRRLYHKLRHKLDDEESLAVLTDEFEKAKYSPRHISRIDYENMMYSKLEVDRELG